VAFISGAASGIGLGMAHAFAGTSLWNERSWISPFRTI
jgi:NAD(P)-dependent dehydrogenase (short-subunit alcohol dehydrogenase family)